MRVQVWAILAGLCGAMAAAPAHAGGRILILAEADARAYEAAFAATARSDWAGADASLARVRDPALASHVLARRYLSPSYRADATERAAWLRDNPDHPLAPFIRGKAAAIGPSAPLPPRRARPLPGAPRPPPGDNPALRAALDRAAERFAEGDLDTAQTLASAHVDGPRAGPASFQLGLISFRRGDWPQAAAAFDAAARWAHWDAGGAAGAAYWGARAHLAAGAPGPALARLQAALAWPATFYGQLAQAQLGRESPLRFIVPPLDAESARAFVHAHPHAHRAAALAQIGRLSDVELELTALHQRLSPAEDGVFLAFAEALDAPGAQLRAAEYGGPDVAAGFCPLGAFAPENGFRVDRAVVLAVTRQESRFRPLAVSSSNARGLMQLLPSTAEDLDDRPFKTTPDLLHDPDLNMRLGQTYLEMLLDQVGGDKDLVKLFAAYNGGPNALRAWLEGPAPRHDPLMALESLPRAETRDYAERVLAAVGLCRARLAQGSHEFEQLAAGKPARYQRRDR